MRPTFIDSGFSFFNYSEKWIKQQNFEIKNKEINGFIVEDGPQLVQKELEKNRCRYILWPFRLDHRSNGKKIVSVNISDTACELGIP
ncbi:hypothetical protein DERP_014639, partial [Dermatophagoides pteronyssinus]